MRENLDRDFYRTLYDQGAQELRQKLEAFQHPRSDQEEVETAVDVLEPEMALEGCRCEEEMTWETEREGLTCITRTTVRPVVPEDANWVKRPRKF